MIQFLKRITFDITLPNTIHFLGFYERRIEFMAKFLPNGYY